LKIANEKFRLHTSAATFLNGQLGILPELAPAEELMNVITSANLNHSAEILGGKGVSPADAPGRWGFARAAFRRQRMILPIKENASMLFCRPNSK
jgi:hypothetical protein